MSAQDHRAELDGLIGLAVRMIQALIRGMYDPADRTASIDALTPPLLELIRSQRAAAHRSALDLIQDDASRHGVDDPYLPPAPGYPEAALRTVLRENLRGALDEAGRAVSDRLVQHVQHAARDTVARASEDFADPSGDVADRQSPDAKPPSADPGPQKRGRKALSWARVLSGAENCGFCVMLASRGPVYSSARDAGRMRASEYFDGTGAIGYVNSYHDNCDCVVVPIYDFRDWDGRDSWKRLDDLYQHVISDARWQDEDGNWREGITYNDGPGRGEKNQVIDALNRELRRMEKAGEELPVDDLRSR